MIVWLNGTHGVGKTTTSALVQQLIPSSRVFDAEMVGEMLMRIEPGLPETDNFQHWPPWRPLVVETARRLLEYTGGTLVVPMTVLVEPYWREIRTSLEQYGIPLRHFVLHADQDTLRSRIEDDRVMGYSTFRIDHLDAYAAAARTWLHDEAEVVDTTNLAPEEVARQIAGAVAGVDSSVDDLAALIRSQHGQSVPPLPKHLGGRPCPVIDFGDDP
ncbi:AAA family ATPase [Mycobacterium sp. AMU20-3851]|uniref:AAA family ATPase n=1 Tax=Mycobacterium sp. AMU20-3851 TaxID=3122055 RepID=UPI003754D0CD